MALQRTLSAKKEETLEKKVKSKREKKMDFTLRRRTSSQGRAPSFVLRETTRVVYSVAARADPLIPSRPIWVMIPEMIPEMTLGHIHGRPLMAAIGSATGSSTAMRPSVQARVSHRHRCMRTPRV